MEDLYGDEYEYLGKKFFVSRMKGRQRWIARVPGWYYEDFIVSTSEAIRKCEEYIEENYNKL